MEHQIMFLFEHTDFPTLIQQAATQLKMPVAFVEKDYWVTYVLYRLRRAGVDDFIFKGGTSLTKAWNLLDRFSEDIDLLFTPCDWSQGKKRKRLKEIQQLVSSFDGLTFDQDVSESKGHYRTDCYNYVIKGERSTVLLPHVKLEMGYRGGDSPSSEIEIQSYLGKLIEAQGGILEAEDVRAFETKVLDLRRTFSEKIFAIYSAFANGEVAKYYRHYYDVYKLLQRKDVLAFLGSAEHRELKSHIAQMSKDFFSTHIPDDLNFATSQAFKHSDELEITLDRALKNSADLFFVAAPSAREILVIIEQHRAKF